MQNNVYCDNELLRDLISDAKPSPGGLYPHELAMIFYTSIGQIQYENPCFAGVFSYQLKVDYPICLLYSLVERGYIRKSRFEENVNFYKTREMQQFVKERGVRSSSKRAVLSEILYSSFSESEIRSVFPQDYFVPTQKGQSELDNTGYTIATAYKGWEENKGYYNVFKPLNICMHFPQITEIAINTNMKDWRYSFVIDGYLSTIKARIIHLPKRSNLTVSKDGRKIFSVDDVDFIRILRRRKVLVFETAKDLSASIELGPKTEVFATGYDIEAESTLYTEFMDHNTVEIGKITFQDYIKKNTAPYGTTIQHGDKIDYYAAVNDQITYLFLSEYLGKQTNQIQVDDVKNFLEDDPTHNIRITVSKSDSDTRNIIHYLANQRLLLTPAICTVNFHRIASCLFVRDAMKSGGSNTRKYYLEDDSGYDTKCSDLITQIDAHDGRLSAFETYFWKFPVQVFSMDMYRYYDSSNGYCNDKNWEYAKAHEAGLRSKYNSFLLKMKEMSLIPTRWVSELSLYFAVCSYFSDAVYQYRCEWLGQQSLDIYIPSKRVGIEYQGKQHYETVEYFGGEQALEETQKRDERKRLLCRENNVQLLTWHYSIEINPDSVYNFLITSGICQLEELKQKSEPISFVEKKHTTKVGEQRVRGNIYCYDKQFSIVGIYHSIAEASHAIGIGKTSIDKALHGERLLAGDCFWYRGEEPLNTIPGSWKERIERERKNTN